MPSRLVAVLHSLPPGGGARTLARVDLARRLLDCDSATVANLYPAQLANVRALEEVVSDDVWDLGRVEILRCLDNSQTTDVLLGYGVSPPSGRQRPLYHAQLAWLARELAARHHRVWVVAGRPVHPSRWQRVAYRMHPEMKFEDAVARLLAQQARAEPTVS